MNAVSGLTVFEPTSSFYLKLGSKDMYVAYAVNRSGIFNLIWHMSRRSLVGCSPWGREESDMTEQLPFHFSLFTFLHWRRKWQPTPVFLPGESQGWGSLVGCRLWGRTELDATEAT